MGSKFIYFFVFIALLGMATVILFSQSLKKSGWLNKRVHRQAAYSAQDWRDILMNNSTTDMARTRQLKERNHETNTGQNRANFKKSQPSFGDTNLSKDEFEELQREVRLGKFRGIKFPENINLRELSLPEIEALRKQMLKQNREEM
ncbi:MAG: hypothetical protein D6813_03580 [Calditrichaeota bacterium]|nr:MAG: hypothetical protein D6813_03580 [Calditrichota bacterium]